ncbi:MAG: ABC transporter ATP-binding protein [Planctomycetota bacterium]|nr:ABC transporter ATP-binding protein [Planctomycetota bacterium]
MRLRADIERRIGTLDLRVALDLGPDETVALVGPNGAGKTTLLRVLAGLLGVDRGKVQLGDTVLDAGPGAAFVPPQERRVGYVFQDHLLFPGMSVLDNVAFGPRSRRATRRDARSSAQTWLERVGLGDLAAARPAALSGGQAQRIALARALAAEPRMLLLDEPLAAVDATARTTLRRELRELLAAFDGVRVLVVHSIDDALALADRLLVLEDGRIVQSGTLPELVARPASRYVADLVGINGFLGHCTAGVVDVAGAKLVVAHAEDGPVHVTFHPRAVSVFRERPSGSPRNVWSAPIVSVEPALERVRLQVGGPLPIVAEITPRAAAELRLAEGGDVWIAVKATEIAVSTA